MVLHWSITGCLLIHTSLNVYTPGIPLTAHSPFLSSRNCLPHDNTCRATIPGQKHDTANMQYARITISMVSH